MAKFYARDLYPEAGSMETSLLAIPGEEEQRTLESDDQATDTAAKVQSGGSKKGIYGTIAVIIAIVAAFGILRK